jgi:hypothetical protein
VAKLKCLNIPVKAGIKRLIEKIEAGALRELEKALLDSGYSHKVKNTIIDWYSKN